jgi:LmbE family N-acetylglucosaminyl deacetylase
LNFYGQRILFVGAHPDDIEIGCGALLAHISRNSDAEVLCVTISDNQKNPKHKNLVEEHYKSMEILGIGEGEILLKDFETRNFPRDRQRILELLYEINGTFKPNIVFAHSDADIHQDHGVVTTEALRAFRGTSVLGFDVLRSSYGFFPNFIVEITEEDMELKVKALAAYETYSSVYYFDPSIIRSTLVRHGALAEKPFAEGFDILRIVGTFQGM